MSLHDTAVRLPEVPGNLMPGSRTEVSTSEFYGWQIEAHDGPIIIRDSLGSHHPARIKRDKRGTFLELDGCEVPEYAQRGVTVLLKPAPDPLADIRAKITARLDRLVREDLELVARIVGVMP